MAGDQTPDKSAGVAIATVLLSVVVAMAGFAGLLSGPAEAKTHRGPIIQVATGICMINGGARGIGCFGDAVPAEFTDGYLWMRKRGRVHHGDAGGLLGPVSQWPVRLRPGDRWVKRKIRCRVIRGGIRCVNLTGHGFQLRKRGYRVW